ncbi:hypothetical protein BXZ70DRAFT_77310 [Cristinia sonorae]|uniref:Uncharacterized protein n=1 Tax=Cristinia sonorae TaxID=1940300 RepID=A0A8K0XR03_9AGAR|nr:hypothetical protein BXZ70DRAFT_77310 [Cristinia sonorae]
MIISPSTPTLAASNEGSAPVASPRSDELKLQQTRDLEPIHPSPRANSEPTPTSLVDRQQRPTLFLGTVGISPVSPAIAEEGGSTITQGPDPYSAVSGQSLTYASRSPTPELVRSPTLTESSITPSEEEGLTPTDIVGDSSPEQSPQSRSASVHSLQEITQTNIPTSALTRSANSSRAPSRLSTPVSHYDIVVSPATDRAARHAEIEAHSRAASRLSMASNYSMIPQASPQHALPGGASAVLNGHTSNRPDSRMSRPRTPLSYYAVTSSIQADARVNERGHSRSTSRLSRADSRPESRTSRISGHSQAQTAPVLPSPPSSGPPSTRLSRTVTTESQYFF